MANQYIQISDDTMATFVNGVETPNTRTYKKVKVLWNDFSEGPVSQQVIERAANGNLLVSIGKTYRIWRGVFKVEANPDTQNGFATKENIEQWSSSDNPLKRKLTMIDNYAKVVDGKTVLYQVFIVTPAEFKYGSPVPDGITSFYLIPFEMQTRGAVTV